MIHKADTGISRVFMVLSTTELKKEPSIEEVVAHSTPGSRRRRVHA
jgi:hypothetical protein